jgi:hypothetical protein
MFRVRIKGSKVKAANSPDQEPDFYALPEVVSSARLKNSAPISATQKCDSPTSEMLQRLAMEDVSGNSDATISLDDTTDCAILLSEPDWLALPTVISLTSATTSTSTCDALRCDSPMAASSQTFKNKNVASNCTIRLSGPDPDLGTQSLLCMFPRCDSPFSTLSQELTEEHVSCGDTPTATFVDTNEYAIPSSVMSLETKLDEMLHEAMCVSNEVTDQLSGDRLSQHSENDCVLR